MNISNKTIMGLVAAAVIGGIGSQLSGKEEGIEPPYTGPDDPDPKDTKDVNLLTPKEANFVYDQKLLDGGHRPILLLPDGQKFLVSDYPCMWRPAGTSKLTCRLVDGGDPGDENTLPIASYTGLTCVKKACVIIWGEQEDSQGKIK